jgi:hypothetical protein
VNVILERLTGALLACAAALALAAPAQAARELGDGTTVDGWALGNGLRVVVRNVPGADAVAIVVAYPSGHDDDPAGQEGLSALMAEVAFTAAAGEVPARTTTELDSQRPAGWNIQTERRRTELAEIATLQQFPGVLHQVAQRMKGVSVTDADVARARAALIERRRATIGADPMVELYVELGQSGAGWDHERMRRWMSGAGLADVRARELAARIAEAYVPARAVLSLAGDFEGIQTRAFIEREFGAIPAGTARQDAMPAGAKGGTAEVIPYAGIERPVGGVGVVAPALTDSLHPSFYLTTLVLGAQAKGMWGDFERSQRSQRSRFQYALLDDPDVARFYPPVTAFDWTPEHMAVQMNALVVAFSAVSIEMAQVKRIHAAVEWLLGGPMSEVLAGRVRTDRSVLYRLCSAAATRELWGGEAFWSEYRRRFDPELSAGSQRWVEYLRDPAHAVLLIYQPPATAR